MDAFDQPYWNLMQLVGWVYVRDPPWVRRTADSVTDYGVNKSKVRLQSDSSIPRFGFSYSSRTAPGTVNLELTASSKGNACASIADSKERIIAALQEGHLKARGLKARGLENGQGEGKEVPQIQRLYLNFFLEGEDGDGRPHAGPIDSSLSGVSRWFNLRFRRSEILAIWPERREVGPETSEHGDQDQNGGRAEVGPQPDAAPQGAVEASSPDLEPTAQEAAATGKPKIEPATRPPSDDAEPAAAPEAQYPAPAPQEAPKEVPPDTGNATYIARAQGRPSYKAYIIAAYNEIRFTGKIDFDAPMSNLYPIVRKRVRRKLGDKKTDDKGLGKEAIRKSIRPLFDRDKARCKTHC